MALWRTRTLSPYQKAEIVVQHEHEDGESYLMIEDAKMTKLYSTELQVNVSYSNVYVHAYIITYILGVCVHNRT